jgi:hypothetical protein
VDDEEGGLILSYRKAKRQKDWEAFLRKHKEGDVVSGIVNCKIKGGLLVNIGVNVFLPATQVDLRRVPDFGELIGQTVESPSWRRSASTRSPQIATATLRARWFRPVPGRSGEPTSFRPLAAPGGAGVAPPGLIQLILTLQRFAGASKHPKL